MGGREFESEKSNVPGLGQVWLVYTMVAGAVA